MKNNKPLYVLIPLALLLICGKLHGQSNVVNTLVSDVKSSGLLSATNYAIEPYFTYAPKLPVKAGAGVLAVYNLNSYIGAGLGVDYLGQLSLISGNVSLKCPIDVGQKAHNYLPDSLTNIVVTPFVLGGIGTGLSGTGGSTISTITDAGGYIQFGKFAGGKFNVGACWGEWANAGDYSGKRYHLFFGWSHGF